MIFPQSKFMKCAALALAAVALPFSLACAANWEKEGDFYFLTKETRDNFSAPGGGANKFTVKYMRYDGIDFLVKGADSWNDYGRIDLRGNTMFSLPLGPGAKIEEIYFLAGGNVGNRYGHDALLQLYGDNYYYGVITVTFIYKDGVCKALSVPVFWDWFRLAPGEWSKDGAGIRYLGNNPVRKDCSLFRLRFANPRPEQPLKDVLVSDSWLSDQPYSDVFAVTVKAHDMADAAARSDRRFPVSAATADKEPADNGTAWTFDEGLDGWTTGCSENWDVYATWQAEAYGRKGVVCIPACAWPREKFAWMEKKIMMPDWGRISLRFLRHSAVFSDAGTQWSDGLLRVTVQGTGGRETVYEKLFSGEWAAESVDVSRYRGQAVIIRFENHGGGTVKLSQTTSPTCDAEDALIDDIRLVKGE